MPANAASVALTNAYRDRLLLVRAATTRRARVGFARLDPADLDTAYGVWADGAAATLAAAKRHGALLSRRYLAAYVSSELGGPHVAPPLDVDAYADVDRAGRPLRQALAAPLYTVKMSLAHGLPWEQALRAGAARMTRTVASEALSAPRGALTDLMAADDRVGGWRRVTAGTCGACMALADGVKRHPGEALHLHDHCRCVAEPAVDGARETVRRPTGLEHFLSLERTQQDALLGRDKAELIRTRQARFEDLIGHSPMDTIADQITEKPLADLTVAPRPLAGTSKGDVVAVRVDGKYVRGVVARAPKDLSDPRRVVNIGTPKKPRWVQSGGDDIFDKAVLKSKDVKAPKPGAKPVEKAKEQIKEQVKERATEQAAAQQPPAAPDVGDTVTVSRGVDPATGKVIPGDSFTGPVVRTADDRVMINTGTPAEPRWVQATVRDLKRAPAKPVVPPAEAFTPATADTAAAATATEKPLAGSAYRSALGQSREPLSQAQRAALNRYTGQDFQRINGGLRNARGGSVPVTQRATVAEIDGAFDAVGPTQVAGKVYRGVDLTRVTGGGRNLQPGAIFEDKGYFSTSVSRKVAEGATSVQGDIFEIIVPKGSRVLDINKVTRSEYGEEKEMLLPRGTRLVIKSVRARKVPPGKIGPPGRIIVAEVLP